MAQQLTPLPGLAAKLLSTYGNAGPGYRKAYLLALDGVLPTVQRNGRYFVADADLPAVAAVLGLTIPADFAAA